MFALWCDHFSILLTRSWSSEELQIRTALEARCMMVSFFFSSDEQYEWCWSPSSFIFFSRRNFERRAYVPAAIPSATRSCTRHIKIILGEHTWSSISRFYNQLADTFPQHRWMLSHTWNFEFMQLFTQLSITKNSKAYLSMLRINLFHALYFFSNDSWSSDNRHTWILVSSQLHALWCDHFSVKVGWLLVLCYCLKIRQARDL